MVPGVEGGLPMCQTKKMMTLSTFLKGNLRFLEVT